MSLMSTSLGSSVVQPASSIVFLAPTTGNDYGRNAVLLPDGDVLFLGQSDEGSTTVLRLRADGSVEPSFGNSGWNPTYFGELAEKICVPNEDQWGGLPPGP